MDYAKLGNDRGVYADAFKKERSTIIAKWFVPVFVLSILLIIGWFGFSFYKKKNNIKLIKNQEIILLGKSVFHPFNSFAEIKEKGMGSYDAVIDEDALEFLSDNVYILLSCYRYSL